MKKYFNPYTDFGFKKLFGEEVNKVLLIDFLNQLLPQHHQIANLTFLNPEKLPDSFGERKAIFDVFCETPTGERFIVEMQKGYLKHFKERSLYYASFPLREQANLAKARGENWDFQLSPIYFIAILDFEYDKEQKHRLFRRDALLKDQKGQNFYDKLHFIYLQMPLFKKQLRQLKTRFDKWCYLLKNLENLENMPKMMNEPIFEKAFKTAEVSRMTFEEHEAYLRSYAEYCEFQAAIDTAVEMHQIEIDKLKLQTEALKGEAEAAKQQLEALKGETEALKEETEALKGETEALKEETEALKGETEALKQQAESAKQQAQAAQKAAQLQLLANLQKMGMSDEAIAQALGVSVQDLQALKSQ